MTVSLMLLTGVLDLKEPERMLERVLVVVLVEDARSVDCGFCASSNGLLLNGICRICDPSYG